MAFLALGLLTDYLSLNALAGPALNELTDRLRVPYGEIDGGYEFNGWYAVDRGARSPSGESLWPARGSRKYVLSFGAARWL